MHVMVYVQKFTAAVSLDSHRKQKKRHSLPNLTVTSNEDTLLLEDSVDDHQRVWNIGK